MLDCNMYYHYLLMSPLQLDSEVTFELASYFKIKKLGSEGLESALSSQGKKTNSHSSNKLSQHQWAPSQWLSYKLGHNVAVSQSISHFVWDKLNDLSVESGLEDTHTHTSALSLRHMATLHLQSGRAS